MDLQKLKRFFSEAKNSLDKLEQKTLKRYNQNADKIFKGTDKFNSVTS